MDSDSVLFEIVHQVVAEFAPEELPLLTAVRGLDPGDALRRLARRSDRDDPLGFGIGEAVVLVTPVVCSALQQVANQAAVASADGLYARAIAWLRGRLGRNKPTMPAPRFGPAELAAVRREVADRATGVGMKPARAQLLADSVVGRLALAGAGQAAGPQDKAEGPE